MNIFKSIKKKRIILIAISLNIFFIMLIYPELLLLSTKKSIVLWVGNILPSLFPFFIFSNLMIALGITRSLPIPVFTFCMSFLSGYPTGAKIIGELFALKVIDKKTAYFLLAFCTTTGPAFIIGTVGISILGSKLEGTILALSHYGASLINGFIFFLILKKVPFDNNDYNIKKSIIGKEPQIVFFNALTEAILNALKSMGLILAYIVIFLFLTDLLEYIGFFSLLDTDFATAIAKGIFEMSIGCFAIAECLCIPLQLKIAALAFIISFGGLSVAGQSMSMLEKTGISMCYYLIVKIIHAIIAAIIAYALTIICLI